MLWWIYKRKHSISNVFIFRIISFNDFWKCLRLRVSTWNFLAVYFIAFWVGFVGNPRVFLSLIFASIRSACSLEILSIPRTHPSCSPLGIVDPHRSLQIWTDIPAAVFLDHSIEITKTLRCNISKIKWYDWQTGQGKVKEEWKYSLMVTGELYAMTNGAFFLF